MLLVLILDAPLSGDRKKPLGRWKPQIAKQPFEKVSPPGTLEPTPGA
jgi:hypothetical protein